MAAVVLRWTAVSGQRLRLGEQLCQGRSWDEVNSCVRAAVMLRWTAASGKRLGWGEQLPQGNSWVEANSCVRAAVGLRWTAVSGQRFCWDEQLCQGSGWVEVNSCVRPAVVMRWTAVSGKSWVEENSCVRTAVVLRWTAVSGQRLGWGEQLCQDRSWSRKNCIIATFESLKQQNLFSKKIITKKENSWVWMNSSVKATVGLMWTAGREQQGQVKQLWQARS